MSKKKVYLFGGSFDPFHIGHEAIAKAVVDEFGSIVLVPTKNPWKGKSLLSLEDKIQDLRTYFKDDPRFEVSDLCTQDEEYNYMYKVIEYYKDFKVVLIMGEDSFEKYPQWRNYMEFKDSVETIVFKRSLGSQIPEAPRVRRLPQELYQNEISSTLYRSNPKQYEHLIPLKLRDIIKTRTQKESS